MEHYEAHHPRLSTQADLPAIGEAVEITEWRHRGYVHALTTRWQSSYPWITLTTDNHSEGGATSRDVLANVNTAISGGGRWDLAFLGVGINDVWRHHQRRLSEAVDIDEYDANVRTALSLLSEATRCIVVIGEPPIGWDPAIDVPAANRDLLEYNQRARRAADDHHALYIDLWDDITRIPPDQHRCSWSPTRHL